VIRTIAGEGAEGESGDGNAPTSAKIVPNAIAVNPARTVIYTANSSVSTVRRIDLSAGTMTITLVAGNGSATASGDSGPATSAGLDAFDVAVDAAGNYYVADRANHRVRRVSPNGIITTIAGTGTVGFAGDNGPAAQANLNSPTDVAIDSVGNIYIADNGNARIRLATTDGVIQRIAGIGVSYPFNGDGPALLVTSAPFGSL